MGWGSYIYELMEYNTLHYVEFGRKTKLENGVAGDITDLGDGERGGSGTPRVPSHILNKCLIKMAITLSQDSN